MDELKTTMSFASSPTRLPCCEVLEYCPLHCLCQSDGLRGIADWMSAFCAMWEFQNMKADSRNASTCPSKCEDSRRRDSQ